MNATTFLGALNWVQPIYGIVVPLFTFIAAFCGTIMVIVLSRPSLISSNTNHILLSMSFCDLLTFLSPLPWYLFAYTFDNHADIGWTNFTCWTFELSVETLPQLFHTASIWLTLLLAIHRYLYICKATTALQLCTNGRTLKIILLLISVSFAHFVPRMFDRDYHILQGKILWHTVGCCHIIF